MDEFELNPWIRNPMENWNLQRQFNDLGLGSSNPLKHNKFGDLIPKQRLPYGQFRAFPEPRAQLSYQEIKSKEEYLADHHTCNCKTADSTRPGIADPSLSNHRRPTLSPAMIPPLLTLPNAPKFFCNTSTIPLYCPQAFGQAGVEEKNMLWPEMPSETFCNLGELSYCTNLPSQEPCNLTITGPIGRMIGGRKRDKFDYDVSYRFKYCNKSNNSILQKVTRTVEMRIGTRIPGPMTTNFMAL